MLNYRMILLILTHANMQKTKTKENIPHVFQQLGNFIDRLRRKFKISIREFCRMARLSPNSYSLLKQGKNMCISFYFRTFGFLINNFCMHEEEKMEYCNEFFRIGMQDARSCWEIEME